MSIRRPIGFTESSIKKGVRQKRRRPFLFQPATTEFGLQSGEFNRPRAFLQPPVSQALNVHLQDKLIPESDKQKPLSKVSELLGRINNVLNKGRQDTVNGMGLIADSIRRLPRWLDRSDSEHQSINSVISDINQHFSPSEQESKSEKQAKQDFVEDMDIFTPEMKAFLRKPVETTFKIEMQEMQEIRDIQLASEPKITDPEIEEDEDEEIKFTPTKLRKSMRLAIERVSKREVQRSTLINLKSMNKGLNLLKESYFREVEEGDEPIRDEVFRKWLLSENAPSDSNKHAKNKNGLWITDSTLARKIKEGQILNLSTRQLTEPFLS